MSQGVASTQSQVFRWKRNGFIEHVAASRKAPPEQWKTEISLGRMQVRSSAL